MIQFTGRNVIAGQAVDMLIYGEGNKITKKGALEDYTRGMLNRQAGQTFRFLYFGDLDREGSRLFFRTREANPGLAVEPFAPLYLLMLQLAQDREMPLSMDKRDIPVAAEDFALGLGCDPAKILNILNQGFYIPQEIINYQILTDILT